jgi:hypothetical protein
VNSLVQNVYNHGHCQSSSESDADDDRDSDDDLSDHDGLIAQNTSLPIDNEFLKKQFPYGVADYGEYIRVKICQACKYCSQIFDRESTLLVHKNCIKARLTEKLGEEIANKESVVTCEFCRREYKDIRGLHKHISYHLDKAFVCKKCPMAFVDGDKANRHILTRKHRKMGPAHNGQFVNLKSSYKVDTAKRPRNFKCPHCDVALTSADGLELHLEKHFDESEKTEKCEFATCKKMFKKRRAMLRHLREHYRHRKDAPRPSTPPPRIQQKPQLNYTMRKPRKPKVQTVEEVDVGSIDLQPESENPQIMEQEAVIET